MYGTFSECINIKPNETTKKFKALKTFNVLITPPCLNIYEGEIIQLTDFGSNELYIFESSNFKFKINKLWISLWTKQGYITEILPDEKPNLNEKSDSILDYEKKYNIYDAVHLMKNHDVTMIDSYFEIEWKFKEGYKTLIGARHNTPIDDFFNKDFGVFDLLDLTFTLVKPVEEAKDKWVRIASKHGLCREIVNGKTIKVNGYILEKDYTDSDIENMFDQLQYGVVEYLEEN